MPVVCYERTSFVGSRAGKEPFGALPHHGCRNRDRPVTELSLPSKNRLLTGVAQSPPDG